jgi:hypothetical protein
MRHPARHLLEWLDSEMLSKHCLPFSCRSLLNAPGHCSHFGYRPAVRCTGACAAAGGPSATHCLLLVAPWH